MLKLDFSIETSDQRAKLVTDFFNANPDYKPTQSELDTLSNYILYGKDPDGTSVVDRGEVEIETKYKSYSKRKAESLDELMETPGFNENTVVTKYVYRHPKPTIDRERDADIPGMRELWQSIDRVAYVIGVCSGDIEPDDTMAPVRVENYTSTDLYKLKHHLIDMRKQQYVLKEAYGGTEHLFNPNVTKSAQLGGAKPDPIDWGNVWFYPLGLMGMPRDNRWAEPQQYDNVITPWDRAQQLDCPLLEGKQVVNFCDEHHIYLLAKAYQDLGVAADLEADGFCKAILDTLEFYVGKAKLSPARQDIWTMKCGQASNDTIRKKVNSEYGTSYNENYISTLFKQNICADIAAAARLHADYFVNRADQSVWKTCSRCGKKKLRDTREYMRKAKSSDGLASRCKECEKEVRDAKKAEQEWR